MSNTPNEPYMFHTVDPEGPFDSCPAMTTLLFKICNNDVHKFNEAIRLVHLFVLKDRELRK